MKETVEKLIEMAKKDALEDLKYAVEEYVQKIEKISEQIEKTVESLKALEELKDIVLCFGVEADEASFILSRYGDRIRVRISAKNCWKEYEIPLDRYEVYLVVKRRRG